ncbi:MAG: hypothetical protein J6U10_04085, partial [Lachnospiraceae bacterium]|nr:hypothetical protein [Lachnospiraceae bacterium]
YHDYEVDKPLFREWCKEYSYCTVHYLRDGLLKIAYDLAESSDKAKVIAIEFYPDYTMHSCSFYDIDYSINPLDLPE